MAVPAEGRLSGGKKNGPQHPRCRGPLPFAEAGKAFGLLLPNLGSVERRVLRVRVVFEEESTNCHGTIRG